MSDEQKASPFSYEATSAIRQQVSNYLNPASDIPEAEP
jgi:hypothetical protein